MRGKSPRYGKLKLIGWRERVALPGLGIEALKVKVDTGARTSALHATNIRYLKKDNGETLVSFLVPLTPKRKLRVRAPLISQRKVKSSLGHATVRPVILTEIALGDEIWSIEVTLVNRDPMGFRMLLGRRAVKGRFLVHPGRSYLQSKADTK
jgi:hypothetical protein